MLRFSQEEEIILACIGRASGAPPDLFEKSVRPDCRWERVLELARSYGILPILHKAITGNGCAPDVPVEVRRAASDGYYETGACNARLFRELGRILEAFSKERIAVMPLKGAASAGLLWGNIALRTMGDLDLLVHPGDLDAAWNLLAALGYRFHLGEHPAEWYRDYYHCPPCIEPVSGAVVELHRGLMQDPIPALSPPAVWKRALPARVAGRDVRSLSPEDAFLYQCMHLWIHFTEGPAVRTLADLSANLQRQGPRMDWEQIVRRARRPRSALTVWLSLLVAQRTGVYVPEPGVIDRLRKLARVKPFRKALLGFLIGLSFFSPAGMNKGLSIPRWRIQAGFESLLAVGSYPRGSLFRTPPWRSAPSRS